LPQTARTGRTARAKRGWYKGIAAGRPVRRGLSRRLISRDFAGRHSAPNRAHLGRRNLGAAMQSALRTALRTTMNIGRGAARKALPHPRPPAVPSSTDDYRNSRSLRDP